MKTMVLINALCFCTLSFSQNYFNLLDTSCFTFGSVFQKNNYYITTGTIFNAEGTASNTLNKIDSLGRVTEIDTISQFPTITNNGIILDVENSFYFFSNINEITPYDPINTDFLLRKYDYDFNLIFEKKIGGINQENAFTFMIDENKSILMVGTTGSFGNTEGDFYLIKTDSLGEIIWEKNYGGINYDGAFSVVKNEKNGYIISGQSQSFSSNMDVLTINTDSLGNILWQKTYGLNAPLLTYGGQTCKLSDKSYIVEKNVLNENTNVTIAKVLKINELGNVIWEKTFTTNPTRTSLEIVAPFELPDGTIILGGISYNDNLRYTGLIYKIDPMGNEIWHKEYERNPIISQDIVDLKPTNDGGFIFGGRAFDSVGPQRAWLVKLDCFGCDSTSCYYQDSVCDFYDCTQFPIDASFTASTNLVDFNNNQAVIFTNNSINTSNRFWSFGDDSLAYTNPSFSHLYTDTGTYQVQLVVYHGMCSDTLTQTVIVSNNIGINEQQMNDLISVYPNPSNGSFSINLLSLQEEIKSIELYDELGRKVFFNTKEINSNILEINEHLAKGIYTLKITAKNKQEIIKKISIQ